MDDNDRRLLEAFRRFGPLPRLSDEPAGDDERNHFAEFYGAAPLNSIAARITRHATRRLSIMDLPGFRYAGRDWVEARRLAEIDLAEAELRVVADEVKS